MTVPHADPPGDPLPPAHDPVSAHPVPPHPPAVTNPVFTTSWPDRATTPNDAAASAPTYPSPPPVDPWALPAPEPPAYEGNRSRTIRVAVILALVVAAAGIGVGYLWQLLAPRTPWIRVEQGFVYGESEPEQAIAADTWFALLGLVAGVLFTLLAWALLRRHRGVAMMIGLIVGSFAGAWVAWWIGIKLGTSNFEATVLAAKVGDRIDGPLGLRVTDLDRKALWPPLITGVASVQAFGVAITYTMLAGFSAFPSLRGPDPSPVPLPLYWPNELPMSGADQSGLEPMSGADQSGAGPMSGADQSGDRGQEPSRPAGTTDSAEADKRDTAGPGAS